MTELAGRSFRAVPSLSRLRVSEKTSLLRDVDGLYVVTEQDLSGLLDANLQQQAERPRGHMREIARIPTTLYHELRQKFGSYKNNEADWKRWLNDPDNRLFRTWHGTV